MWELAIKALADAFASFCNWRTVCVKNQSITEVIKDKQELSEACEYAELAIELVERGAVFRKSKHQRRFRSYVRRFRGLK